VQATHSEHHPFFSWHTTKVVLMCGPLRQYENMPSSFQKKQSTQASLMVMPVDHQLISQEALASQL